MGSVMALFQTEFRFVAIEVLGGKQRKYYRATPAGEAALAEVMVKVRELVGEVGLDVPLSNQASGA